MSDTQEDQPAPDHPILRIDPTTNGDHRVLMEKRDGTFRRFVADAKHLYGVIVSVLIGEFGMEQEAAHAHAKEQIASELLRQEADEYIEKLKARVASLQEQLDYLTKAHDALKAENEQLKAAPAPAEQKAPDSAAPAQPEAQAENANAGTSS